MPVSSDNNNGRRRIVVTGIGAVTSLGNTFESTWEGLIAGRSGAGPITQFDTTGYAPDTAREVYQQAFGEWMKTDPRATVGDLEALAAWDGAARVGAITVPVVVVVGEHEPQDAKAAADALAGAVTGGRVEVLAGAGRRGVLEQPAALAAIVATVAEGVPA